MEERKIIKRGRRNKKWVVYIDYDKAEEYDTLEQALEHYAKVGKLIEMIDVNGDELHHQTKYEIKNEQGQFDKLIVVDYIWE